MGNSHISVHSTLKHRAGYTDSAVTITQSMNTFYHDLVSHTAHITCKKSMGNSHILVHSTLKHRAGYTDSAVYYYTVNEYFLSRSCLTHSPYHMQEIDG